MKNIKTKATDSTSKSKNAFTIAELIITTIIMAVVMIIAPIMTLKRNVKPSTAKNLDFIAKCEDKCIFDARSAVLTTSSGEETKLDYNRNSNEFYAIELVGGGGGGTSKSFGYPGESKIIYLPSLGDNIEVTNPDKSGSKYKGILSGYYLLEAGEGGTGGGSTTAYSGNASRICIIDETVSLSSSLTCDDYTTIATAQGGITSGENASVLGEDDSSRYAAVVSDGSTYYGSGGTKQSVGTDGVIVIK